QDFGFLRPADIPDGRLISPEHQHDRPVRAIDRDVDLSPFVAALVDLERDLSPRVRSRRENGKLRGKCELGKATDGLFRWALLRFPIGTDVESRELGTGATGWLGRVGIAGTHVLPGSLALADPEVGEARKRELDRTHSAIGRDGDDGIYLG